MASLTLFPLKGIKTLFLTPPKILDCYFLLFLIVNTVEVIDDKTIRFRSHGLTIVSSL